MMMSGVPLETCWAFNKFWNNKFYYKAASCWYFYWIIHDGRIHKYQNLHVSDRFSVHHQESSTIYTGIGICHTGYADCCPKHVEFYYKNKFEKLLHLVSFIIRIHHDARSSECQTTPFCCFIILWPKYSPHRYSRTASASILPSV